MLTQNMYSKQFLLDGNPQAIEAEEFPIAQLVAIGVTQPGRKIESKLTITVLNQGVNCAKFTHDTNLTYIGALAHDGRGNVLLGVDADLNLGSQVVRETLARMASIVINQIGDKKGAFDIRLAGLKDVRRVQHALMLSGTKSDGSDAKITALVSSEGRQLNCAFFDPTFENRDQVRICGIGQLRAHAVTFDLATRRQSGLQSTELLDIGVSHCAFSRLVHENQANFAAAMSAYGAGGRNTLWLVRFEIRDRGLLHITLHERLAENGGGTLTTVAGRTPGLHGYENGVAIIVNGDGYTTFFINQRGNENAPIRVAGGNETLNMGAIEKLRNLFRSRTA